MENKETLMPSQEPGGWLTAIISYRKWIPWAVLWLTILNIPAITNGYRLTALGLPGLDRFIIIDTAIIAIQRFAIPILFTLIIAEAIAEAIAKIVRKADNKSNTLKTYTFVEHQQLKSGKLEALASGISTTAYLTGQLYLVTILATNLFYPVVELGPTIAVGTTLILQTITCGVYIIYVYLLAIYYTLYRKPYEKLYRLSEKLDARLAEEEAKRKEESGRMGNDSEDWRNGTDS